MKEEERGKSKERREWRSEEEKEMVKMWEEVLGVKGIGVEENFFELGGHSLKATRMVSRMRDIFHIELPLHVVFESQTIAELAEVVQKSKADTFGTGMTSIKRVSRDRFRQQVNSQGEVEIPEELIDTRKPVLIEDDGREIGENERPRTDVEAIMLGLWKEVLGRKQIGIHDNFFDMGGHSLLATRLISRARKTFHVELPLDKVFDSQTIAGLSELVEQIKASNPAPDLTPIKRVSREHFRQPAGQRGALVISAAPVKKKDESRETD
jgi:acyl carrier protein